MRVEIEEYLEVTIRNLEAVRDSGNSDTITSLIASAKCTALYDIKYRIALIALDETKARVARMEILKNEVPS